MSDSRLLLRCIGGPQAGRVLEVGIAAGLSLPVRQGEQVAGHLQVCAAQGQWWLRNRSPLPARLNGRDVGPEALLAHGDRIALGALVLEVDTGLVAREVATEELPLPASPAAERASRRISASRLSPVVDSPPKKSSIISRVGKALRRRDERGERLDQLELERLEILREAGRRALEGQGGIGLPDGYLLELRRQGTVTVAIEDLAPGALERHRQLSQRLTVLDAAILAMRNELGRGPDSGLLPRSLPLLSEAQEVEEEVFESMDAINTDELGQLCEADGDDRTTVAYASDPDEDTDGASPRSPAGPRRRAKVRRR